MTPVWMVPCKNFRASVGAMKIARNPRTLASTRLNGMHPLPAPSLRECPPMNGTVSNPLSFVGAMKIARTLTV